MKIIKSTPETRRACLQVRRSGRTIGFVPTMGALHEGHLSLIRLARRSSDSVVVSIFVNPIQFGPGEDLSRYPRDLARDARLCEDEGVDILFCPEAGEFYAPDHSVYVEEERISRSLCGLSRPGHFRGVATVVSKLFNVVQPDVAVFGQKDAQQCRIIQQLVRDLGFPVKIVVAPTAREPDGLAMSSRNVYLSAEDRRDALCLSQALRLAGSLWDSGERDSCELKKRMEELIRRTPAVEIEYIEILDYRSWEPTGAAAGRTLVAVAAKIGKVRLIDNIVIGDDAGPPASSPQP